MTKEVIEFSDEEDDSVIYIQKVIEALYENSDQVSVEAAELLERINAKQEQNEPVAWVDLLKDAEQIIKDKFLYKRFIDGTPLSNDIPCWMVDFAQKYATPQPKQKQGEFVANDPLPRACNLAGVDYQTFLKIKTYMPLYTTPQPKEWVGLTEYEIKGVLGLSESWVGEDCSIPDMIGFAKAIQAKSKEKNYVVFGK